MLIITATWHAKPGKEAELKKQLELMVHAVRGAEAECIEYTLHQGTHNPALFFFYEKYESLAAFEFHKNTKHFALLIKQTASLIAQPVSVQSLEPLT